MADSLLSMFSPEPFLAELTERVARQPEPFIAVGVSILGWFLVRAYLSYLWSYAQRHHLILLLPYHFCSYLLVLCGVILCLCAYYFHVPVMTVIGFFCIAYGGWVLLFENPRNSAIYLVLNGTVGDLRDIILSLPETELCGGPFGSLSKIQLVGRSPSSAANDPRTVGIKWGQNGLIDIINTYRRHRFMGFPSLKFFPSTSASPALLAQAINGITFQRASAAGAFAEMLEGEAQVTKTVRVLNKAHPFAIGIV